MQQIARLCTELAVVGGDEALQAFHSRKFTTDLKSDKSYVTTADKAIEKQLRQRISEAFPTHIVWGEEDGGDVSDSKITWNIDPIDGTHNFMYGIPVFGTLISVTQGTNTLCSAAYDPNTKTVFSAIAGHGAFVNGKKFTAVAAEPVSLKKSTLIIDWGKTDEAQSISREYLYKKGTAFRSFRKYGCVVPPYHFAYSGHFGALVFFGLDTRETSVLAPFFSEAGFKVTTHLGQAWNLENGEDMVIAPEALLEEVLATLG